VNIYGKKETKIERKKIKENETKIEKKKIKENETKIETEKIKGSATKTKTKETNKKKKKNKTILDLILGHYQNKDLEGHQKRISKKSSWKELSGGIALKKRIFLKAAGICIQRECTT